MRVYFWPALLGLAAGGAVFLLALSGGRMAPRFGSHSFAAAFTHTAPYAAAAFGVCAALSLVLPKTAVADDHG